MLMILSVNVWIVSTALDFSILSLTEEDISLASCFAVVCSLIAVSYINAAFLLISSEEDLPFSALSFMPSSSG